MLLMPQWSPLLGSGMTLGRPIKIRVIAEPQWSPLLGSGMTGALGISGINQWLRAAMEPAPWERDDRAPSEHREQGLGAAMEPAPWERDDAKLLALEPGLGPKLCDHSCDLAR